MGPKRRRQDAGHDADSSPPAKRVATLRRNIKSEANPSRPSRTRTGPKETSVFDTLDALPSQRRSVTDNKAYLEAEAGEDSESDEDSDDSDDFEDVAGISRQHVGPPKMNGQIVKSSLPQEDDSGMDEEDLEWEDAIDTSKTANEVEEMQINDISITLGEDSAASTGNNLAFDDARGIVGKKGPSKIERSIRLNTHCMHVQLLLFHNFVRNSWLNDAALHKILLGQLSVGLRREVDRWRIACGSTVEQDAIEPDACGDPLRHKKSDKATLSRRQNAKAAVEAIPRGHTRDWGAGAERLEAGVPDTSQGDPTVRLMKYLAAYWHKRFRVVSPSLQKRGYLQPRRLEMHLKRWANATDQSMNLASFGERIANRSELRKAARSCRGSKDVGAQLFTSLVRAIGIKARMVASLQPVGFGFSKVEDAQIGDEVPREELTADESNFSGLGKAGARLTKNKSRAGPRQGRKTRPVEKTLSKGHLASAPISLDTSSSDELSDVPSDMSIDIKDPETTTTETQPAEQKLKGPQSQCPTYWTEVISPVTDAVIPVVALPSPLIANSVELLHAFTPSGKLAERTKQVLAYVIAYADDELAKDVTVRYLRKKLWPGKTRGFRIPKERIAVHNKRGKIVTHVDWDWFERALGVYQVKGRPRARAEELEDEVDLVATTATTKDSEGKSANEVSGKPESLSAYKSSAEFVLERHLRREEALLPHAAIVRYFNIGKGESATKEPVYRRKDVVTCKTIESWHKEGRCIRGGAEPLKQVPIRAVTLIRKREAEEMQRETGEKPMQGLYAKSQTDWIVPEPLGPDRKIPRNVFGSIDIYVPSMVPEGAVHIPLKGTAKLCRRLDIDYAEACTGFEFGKQRAVPVITGVVVAKENKELVKDAWRAEQKVIKEKERLKRKAAALTVWKKFYAGLRITEKMIDRYGHVSNLANGSQEVVAGKGKERHKQILDRQDPATVAQEDGFFNNRSETPELMTTVDYVEEDAGGGFFREGLDVIIPSAVRSSTMQLSPNLEGVERASPPASLPNESVDKDLDSDVKNRSNPKPHDRRSKLNGSSKQQGDARQGQNVDGLEDKSLLQHRDTAKVKTNGIIRGGKKRAARCEVVIKAEKAPSAAVEKRRTPGRRAAKDVRSRYFESPSVESD